MSKAFSVLSWNIEHLRDKQPKRIKRVVATLKAEKPDVFALYEIEGKYIYEDLVTELPNYSFNITEGPQTQEILVGIKNKITSFFTQRVEFKSGNTWLRPGAMLSLKIDNEHYTLMFLHLKSLTKPIGLGIRDDQFERLYKLKKKLDINAGENKRSNFIALGDFNTMGMNYRGTNYDIPAHAELNKLGLDIKRKSVKMLLLNKSTPNTWSNGSNSSYTPSDLDHVIASDHMKFKLWDSKPVINETNNLKNLKCHIDVRGWVDQSTINKQDKWIEEFSDHSYLYFEVQKV